VIIIPFQGNEIFFRKRVRLCKESLAYLIRPLAAAKKKKKETKKRRKEKRKQIIK
jgi:hypothetical protein